LLRLAQASDCAIDQFVKPQGASRRARGSSYKSRTCTFGFSAPFAQAKQPGSNVYTPIPMNSGAHSVTATVVDAVGVLAVSAKQSVTTAGNIGPSGPIGPNVDPSRQDFDVAGNANDPINGRP